MWYNDREIQRSITMKTKKILPAFALALAISALAGCSGDKTVALDNYWDYNSLTEKNTLDETLVYDVTFDAGAGLELVNYQLDYKNGTYTTTVKSGTHDGKYVYTFTTQLTIDAVYTLGEQTKTYTDKITTETVFYDVANSLRPISSVKTIVSHSPKNGDSYTNVEACAYPVDQKIETVYEDNKGTCTRTDNLLEADEQSKPHTFTMDEKYTYLDNEQLLFAIRGFSSSTTSATVKTYTPFVSNLQKVKFTFAETDEDEATKFTISENGGEATTKAISYRTANIALDEVNPGGTQIAWLATGASDKNTYRNVILRLETPLSYSLGTLYYKLKSIDRK